MNNQGQPPQQGQPNPMAGQQAAGGHPAGAPRPANMYRPEMMRNLPILNDEEKTKYERGLRSLWNSMESHPEDAPAHLEAKKKIQDFTKMLMGKLQARRLQMQQHQQQQKEAQAQAQSQAQGQGQAQIQTPAQQPTPQVQPPSQPAPLQSAAPAVPAQLPQTAGVPATQDPSGGAPSQPTSQPSNNAAPSAPADTMPPAAAAPAQSAPGQAAAQPQHSIPDHIMQHVRLMTFNAPAQIVAEKGQEAAAKWSSDMKSRYLKSLMQMEHSGLQIRKISALVKDRQEKGVPLSAEDLKQMQVRREHNQKVYADAQRFVEQFRKSQEISKSNAAAGAARPAQQGNVSAPAAGASQPGAQASPPPVAGQPVQVPQPMAAAPAQAQAQAQLQPAQSLSNGPGVVGAAGTVPQQPPAQARQQPPVQQSLPAAAPGTVPTTNANPATQTQQQQQPLPQQVNTATATQPQMASASTPTQPAPRVQTPQSALPGGSQVLSHSAAVSRANQRVNSQVGGIAPQPGTGTPTAGSAPTQGAAASTAMGGVQQSQPPATTPTPQTSHTLQSKLPIPKNLPERAQGPPQPVSMAGGAGAGRPTYSGGTGIAGGVMGQPAMQRIPVFSQEAEGDHVLSKKKLDELVRQVCGGTAEGQEGNLLSPEVEENVLGLADSFVDNVLNAACRNAKERGSKVLEIRDIQLVLERTYNIRVPGYSSDDLRTVRKVQPAPAWITKMSAIQAAKVTSGKTE